MTAVTQGRYPLLDVHDADTIVIHCSDPRFQTAFQRFVGEELGVEAAIPIVVPGGVHDLVSPARVKAARQLWAHVEFMARRDQVRRVILLNHEDCQWYRKWSALTRRTVGDDIATHLLEAAKTLASRKFGVEVDSFLAKIEDGEVVFYRVE